MEGLYRVYYVTAEGAKGFYAINAVDEADALEEGQRLLSWGYGSDARITGARLLRPTATSFQDPAS